MATIGREIELGREPGAQAGAVRQGLWLRLHARAPLLASTGAAFISTTLTGVLGFVFWVVAARLYPASSLGLASAAISTMFLIGNISRLGLDYTLAMVLPRTADRRERHAISLVALMTVGGVGALVATAFLAQPLFSGEVRSLLDESVWVAVGFVLASAAWGAGLVLDQLLLVGRMGQHMIGKNATFSLVRLATLAIALPLVGDRYGILAATALGVAAGLVLLWKELRAGVLAGMGSLGTGLRQVRSLLAGPAIGNYFAALVSGLPGWILPVLVVERASSSDAAHFYTAWMVVTLVNSGPSALAAGLLAEDGRKGRGGKSLLGKAYKYAAIFMLPSVAGLMVAAPLILGVFGSGYQASTSELLRYLAAGSIPYTIVQINFIRLRLENKMRLLGVAAVLLSGVCLAGSYLLLPVMGLRGVGVAWLVSASLAAIVSAFGVYRRSGVRGQGSGLIVCGD